MVLRASPSFVWFRTQSCHYHKSNVSIGPESGGSSPDDLIRILQIDVIAHDDVYSSFRHRRMGNDHFRLPDTSFTKSVVTSLLYATLEFFVTMIIFPFVP